MKRFIFLLLLNSFFTSGFAQFDFGVSLGATHNYEIVYPEDYRDFEKNLMINPSVGAMVRYSITDPFRISTGIDLKSKGSYITGESNYYNNITHHFKNRSFFVQVPLKLEYNIRNKYGIKCGAYYSFGVAGNFETKHTFNGKTLDNYNFGNTSGDIVHSKTLPENFVNDEIHRWPIDFGLIFGLSYVIKRFELSLKYEMGLQDSTPYGSNMLTPDLDHYYRTAEFSMTYVFAEL